MVVVRERRGTSHCPRPDGSRAFTPRETECFAHSSWVTNHNHQARARLCNNELGNLAPRPPILFAVARVEYQGFPLVVGSGEPDSSIISGLSRVYG